MNRATMRTRILERLRDDPALPVYWSLTEIDRLIDDGRQVLVEQAPVIKRSVTVPRRPGVSIYQLPSLGLRVMAPYRLWLADLHRRLEARSIDDLEAEHELWMLQTGEPLAWYPLSWDSFGIWPTPTEGGGLMDIDYYAWPGPWYEDSDEPDLTAASQESLVVYGEMRGALKEWDAARAREKLLAFEGQARQVKAQTGLRLAQGFHWRRQPHT